MRRVCIAVSLAVIGALAFTAPAGAIYGLPAGGLGAEIVSVDHASDEQADASTSDAAISADGRYVVFQTRATNFYENDGVAGGDPEPPGACRQGGLFRYDRDTGELALVADGNEVAVNAEGECEPSHVILGGAESPSTSADGRYIAFDTAQRLVPQDANDNFDVYVRDMNVPLAADRKASGAYTLVSAKNGGEEPAVYVPKETQPGREPGSEVWPNTAISGNGRYVAFRTGEAASDLPDDAAVETPPQQLFVRDLRDKATTLLSVQKKGESEAGKPAGGAIGPATISADGSTVAWVAIAAPAQTRFLGGEPLNTSEPYYLWRHWQEPEAATRRVTGIADLDDHACPPGGEVTLSQTATGPCYGPLSEPESTLASIALTAPGLSTDGYTVAFLAGAALRPNITKTNGLDVFLTSMRPGVSRKAGTHELTLGVQSGNAGSTPSIESLALSPDGSTIAFTSLREDFVLPDPQPVGVFRGFPTVSDLYVVHLGANTLERAVVGDESGDPNRSVAVNPTLSQDGSKVAFVSAASNLIYGDGNGFPDAFTGTLQLPGGTSTPPGGVNGGSDGFSLTAVSSPELGVSVKRAKDGGVILLVETPGPGKLVAKARGVIPKAAAAKSVRARKSLAHTAKTKKKSKAQTSVLLASASATARSEGTTTLTLHLSAKYLKDLKRAGKLKANVVIDFTPPAPAEALSDEVPATFVVASPAKRSSGKVRGKAKKG